MAIADAIAAVADVNRSMRPKPHEQTLTSRAELIFGDKLGSGAFGEVFLAKTWLGGSCVVKQVSISSLEEDQQRAALNEVRVLSLLDHKNIVEYFCSFVEDQVLHIVMEYCASRAPAPTAPLTRPITSSLSP